ncbi:hypothetical protein ACR42D_08840 [Desulfovibrio caledoniensis]
MLKKVLMGLEILGLVIILMASIWQIYATDWWETQLTEWGIIIDREADHATLEAISILAEIVAAENPNEKTLSKERLTTFISESRLRLIKETQNRRSAMENGQYPWFVSIRLWLFLVGSSLAIGCKLLELISWLSTRNNQNPGPTQNQAP